MFKKERVTPFFVIIQVGKVKDMKLDLEEFFEEENIEQEKALKMMLGLVNWKLKNESNKKEIKKLLEIKNRIKNKQDKENNN